MTELAIILATFAAAIFLYEWLCETKPPPASEQTFDFKDPNAWAHHTLFRNESRRTLQPGEPVFWTGTPGVVPPNHWNHTWDHETLICKRCGISKQQALMERQETCQ